MSSGELRLDLAVQLPAEIGGWLHLQRLRTAAVAFARATPGPVVAIKGLGLHFAWGGRQRMNDADVVVRHGFRRYVDAALASGAFTLRYDNYSTQGIHHTLGGTLDVHRAAFPPFWGNFSNSALFRRARPCPALQPLLVPDPVDALIIALGNHVKDCLGAPRMGHGPTVVCADVDTLAGQGVTPRELVARAEEHGVRRIAALGCHSLLESGLSKRWLDAFHCSRLELEWIALAGRHLRGLDASHQELAYLWTRILPDQWLVSLGVGLTRVIRDAVRRHTS